VSFTARTSGRSAAVPVAEVRFDGWIFPKGVVFA